MPFSGMCCPTANPCIELHTACLRQATNSQQRRNFTSELPDQHQFPTPETITDLIPLAMLTDLPLLHI
eukprot:10804459-Lingulodinium_polyedra.AAC.1